MQNTFKKILTIILIIILIIAFSSSYNYSNIDNLAFVVALGIDVSDTKNIKVTFQFVKPPSTSEGSNQESKIFEDSVDCDSIINGINIMNSYIARKLDLSHCRVIIFSEEVAKNGISDYVYSLMNDVQVRPRSNIIVSKCSASYYIENSVPSLETSITKYYDIFHNSGKYTGYINTATIGDFFNALSCNNCEPYAILGGVSSGKGTSDTLTSTDSNVKANSSPISGSRSTENIGTAVFKEGQLVGELTGVETMCLNLLKGNLNSFVLSIPEPTNSNNENSSDKKIDLLIMPKSKKKINAQIINGSPYIKIDIELSAKIYSLSKNSNYEDTTVLSSISNSCNKYLESLISDYLYKTSKEFKSDINGLGRYLLSDFTTNKQFNDFGWLNNYINTTFDVNVDTNVDSGFLLKKT